MTDIAAGLSNLGAFNFIENSPPPSANLNQAEIEAANRFEATDSLQLSEESIELSRQFNTTPVEETVFENLEALPANDRDQLEATGRDPETSILNNSEEFFQDAENDNTVTTEETEQDTETNADTDTATETGTVQTTAAATVVGETNPITVTTGTEAIPEEDPVTPETAATATQADPGITQPTTPEATGTIEEEPVTEEDEENPNAPNPLEAVTNPQAEANAVLNNANGLAPEAAPTNSEVNTAPETPENEEQVLLQNVGAQLAQTVPAPNIISVLG
ncbi:MAG: hypothetical protein GY765_12875 [bacterium]|nr:hypothetical protein [bacterium]